MKVIEHLQNAKKSLISFEILPPLKGKSIQSIYGILDPLMEFKPPFINVTYHRSEFIYKKTSTGFFEKVVTRKRPGTVGICAAIMNKYKVDAVPHLTCGGFTKEDTEDALVDLNFLGIDNVLLIRGDAAKSEANFLPEPGGHEFTVDLVKQVSDMNKGIYLDDELSDPIHSDFCIGVGGYPEKHFEAPSLAVDLKHLKEKVDAGASYITTQMFYDNQRYFDFVKACRDCGIDVPIIPGLKPITVKKHIANLPRAFHISMPDDLINAVEKCKTDEQVSQVGIEWAVHQSKELLKFGVPCLHFYTMGRIQNMVQIAKQIM